MKINKMSMEDLRAAIALYKSNRYSKFFKDLCSELIKRRYKAGFFSNINRSYEFQLRVHQVVLRNTMSLENPELI